MATVFPIPRIICIGDSITERGFDTSLNGWVAQLQYLFGSKADVINRGISGFNSRQYVHYIASPQFRDIFESKYKSVPGFFHLVTVCLGANDASFQSLNPKQHIPLDEFRRNMFTIVATLAELGVESSRIVVIAPPPVVDPQKYPHHSEATACHSEAVTSAYRDAAAEVAKVSGCRFCDVRAYKYDDIWVDGIHLNKAGNELVVRAVLDVIKSELSPNSLRYNKKHWSDYDPEQEIF